MSDFVDFGNKAGTLKITKVKQIYNRPKYHPSQDFYKKLRELLILSLQEDSDLKSILKFIEYEAHPKKKPHYLTIYKGFNKFIKRVKPKWITPIHGVFEYKDLNVKISPEIGLLIDGEKYLVKLHFKDSKITQSEAKCALRLMKKTLCKDEFKDFKVALLDLRKGKLYESKSSDPYIDELIEAEAQSLIRIWEGFEKS